jgi:ankyrin repeat protein
MLLLGYGANPNYVNGKGNTALMYSAQEGHLKICDILVVRTSVNHKNFLGMSSLMLASFRGHDEVLELLIRSGAVVDEQTWEGNTALMMACSKGHNKCVEILVSFGAEIFLRDCHGNTAIDVAKLSGNIGMLCFLDTQYQVLQIQKKHHKMRHVSMIQFRGAAIKNRLKRVSHVGLIKKDSSPLKFDWQSLFLR